MTKWREITIGDIGRVVTGKTPSTKNKQFWDGKFPFITPVDLQKSKNIFHTERTVSAEGLDSVKGAVLPPGAVCVSCIGNLGYTAMTTQVSISNQQINSIIPNTDYDDDFVYYAVKNLWSEFKNLEGQSTTLSILNKTLFSKIQLSIPDLTTQQRIAKLLSSLDDKIELNTQINQNLEAQAQAIFKSWFVGTANPHWHIGTIADLGEVVGGSTPSKAHSEYYTEHGIAWITPKDLSVDKSKFISHGEIDITQAGLKNSSAKVMPKGTVLFSSRAPIGYIAIAAGDVCTNQGFKSVVPHVHIATPYVYFFLKENLPSIEGVATGSTFKEVSGSAMKSVPAIIPDSDTLSRFTELCVPLFETQEKLEAESRRLAILRDTLLPKLMSGEIDVSEVEV